MKKTYTLLLLLAFLAVSGNSLLNAQVPDGYYKKFHIDQNFTGLEAVPTGWVINSSTTALFRSGGIAVADGVVKATGSGGGTRGVDLSFPTPQSNTVIGQPTDSIWYFEMDWTVNGATLGPKNALGLLIAGSKSQSLNTANYYADGIFGFYVFGDGFLHYSNLDQQGPLKITIDPAFTGDPNESYGPAIYSGQYPGFGRGAADAATAALINASTITTVAYAAGKSYHITAILNFSTQKVVKLIITDNADPLNTQTFEDHAFLAPSLVTTTTTVPVEQRKVTDIAIIASANTRSSNAGNGSNAALNVYYDNIQIYRPELSLGMTNLTINYKDRQGGTAKAARTVDNLQVSTTYSLLGSDKTGFIEGNNYFAYDAEATHAANAGKGSDDGESVVVATGASLDVIFKKSPLTNGTYVWTGTAGANWSELEDNFSVGGGAAMSFQNGNAATFSNANAGNKEIQLPANLNLGEGNLTISAAEYSFSGAGRLEGTGSLIINEATTLGIDNRLTGGALISTADPVHIKHAGAAKSYKLLVDDASLILEAEADFTAPVETPENGTINVECVSNFIYSPVLTNTSTINIIMSTAGSHNTNWRSAWRTTFPAGAQVNVFTTLEDLVRPAGFGVRGTDLKNSKLHLGDNIRLLRDYNETNNTTYSSIVAIGELSGTDKAVIESGFIDGRSSTYEVGYLNTDAVFNGVIRQYMPTDTTSTTSLLRLSKMGTGTWTINGNLLFSGEILVDNGTLALGGNVASSITKINVDTAAIFVAKKIVAQTGIAVNIGTLSGSLTANSISLTGSTLKMNANSFAEGNFDKIVTIGDFTTIAAVNPENLNILDVTVNSANKNERIKIIEVKGNADVSFNKILVNGEDITLNTAETAGAKFAFIWDEATNSGDLLSLTNYISALDEVSTDKIINSELYYNATGQVVGKNSKGFLIKITTYTDGTKKIEKTIEFDR